MNKYIELAERLDLLNEMCHGLDIMVDLEAQTMTVKVDTWNTLGPYKNPLAVGYLEQNKDPNMPPIEWYVLNDRQGGVTFTGNTSMVKAFQVLDYVLEHVDEVYAKAYPIARDRVKSREVTTLSVLDELDRVFKEKPEEILADAIKPNLEDYEYSR